MPSETDRHFLPRAATKWWIESFSVRRIDMGIVDSTVCVSLCICVWMWLTICIQKKSAFWSWLSNQLVGPVVRQRARLLCLICPSLGIAWGESYRNHAPGNCGKRLYYWKLDLFISRPVGWNRCCIGKDFTSFQRPLAQNACVFNFFFLFVCFLSRFNKTYCDIRNLWFPLQSSAKDNI